MNQEKNFINKNKEKWKRLEKYIISLSKNGPSGLTPTELKEFIALTKLTSHQLSYLRTYNPKSQLIDYVNQLSVKAHNQLYITKKIEFRKVIEYFTYILPYNLRKITPYFLISCLFFMSCAVLSYVLVLNDTEKAAYFLPEFIAQNVQLSDEGTGYSKEVYPILSTYIMYNNIGVSIKSFTYGITAGIGTLYILFQNGIMLGSLSGLMQSNGNDMIIYWSLILPHGVLELYAIFVSGACGLMLGKSIIIPGKYKRITSLIKVAKEAVIFIPGIIIMLVIAGLIEGFITPTPMPSEYKLIIAMVTFVLLSLYIVFAGKKRKNI